MLIWGINSVKEALESGIEIKRIFIAGRADLRIREITLKAEQSHIQVLRKEKDFFNDIKSKVVQYVAAEIDLKLISFEELLLHNSDKTPVFIVLDLIEDPRNLGAVIRSAAACSVDGIIIQSRRSCKITPAVFAASAGTVAHVRISEISNIKTALRAFREEGYQLIGAGSEGESAFWDIDYLMPTVFVVGSEGKGIRKTVRVLCDRIVRIPMSEKVSSLNVSVAAGVLLYEFVRQNTGK